MFYFIKTPWFIKSIYKSCSWSIKTNEKILYLTFDDGPHPVITPFVLDELKKINARATFFCIGKNVVAHPVIYQRIIDEGHAIGNHTYNHLNGWKTSDNIYLDDIELAEKYIRSNLFRPPYGRITRFQIRQIASPRFQLQTIMWSILSGDFDINLKPAKCLENVVLNARPGDIIVFHDSERALDRLKFVLPGTLKYFKEKGYRFEKIEY